MLHAALSWLGFAEGVDHGHHHGDDHHDHGGHGHGHTHGVIDPSIATTARGIWAIKWSFVILAITSLMQLVIVALSGSVALLADTIHNLRCGDRDPTLDRVRPCPAPAEPALYLRLRPGRGPGRGDHRWHHPVQRDRRRMASG
jgi:hypothetical protein